MGRNRPGWLLFDRFELVCGAFGVDAVDVQTLECRLSPICTQLVLGG